MYLLFLAALDLHCGAWALQLWHLGLAVMWDLSSPIRDWTQVPCTGRRILNIGHTGPPGSPVFYLSESQFPHLENENTISYFSSLITVGKQLPTVVSSQ